MSDYDYENMLNRLKSAMNEQSLTIKKLAKLAEVPYGTLYKVFSGETKEPSINMIIKVAAILDVTADYLIYGKNKKTSNDHILKKYDALDAHGKEIVDTVINIEYERCTNINDNGTDSSSTIIKIPLADSSLSAGTGNLLLDT